MYKAVRYTRLLKICCYRFTITRSVAVWHINIKAVDGSMVISNTWPIGFFRGLDEQLKQLIRGIPIPNELLYALTMSYPIGSAMTA